MIANGNLGILAHNFGKLPLDELARNIGASGLRTVQLALLKAIADIDCSTGKLSPGLAHHIAEAFDRSGVRIAVLGCYINPIHPDPAVRREEIRRFKEHLRYCRDFGTSLVATETGRITTYKDQYPDSYEEKAFSVLRETVLELTEEAAKWGVTAVIEPASSLIIGSTEQMVRLLEEVPAANTGVLLDACNLLHAGNWQRRDDVIREAFDALADRTVMFHLKDAVMTAAGDRQSSTIGQGEVNFPLLLELIKRSKPHADMTMEGLEVNQVAASIDYIDKVWKSL